jgi:Tfp pilus assembly protein PilF
MDHIQRQDMLDEACDSLAAGHSAKALAVLDQLAATQDDFAPVHFLRAHALLLQGDQAEALAEAQQGVKLAPANPAAHRVLAWAAWQNDRLAVAQQALETLIQLEHGSPDSLAEYAEFMACERGPKLGEDAARQAIACNERSATAWAALGIAQYRQHQRDAAEASLMRALKIDSENARAQWGMIRLLQDKGQHAKAEALASFLRQAPGGAAFADQVHRAASRQRVVAKLFDRPGVAEEISRRQDRFEPYLPWMVWALVLAMIVGLAIVFPGFRVPGMMLGVVSLFIALRYCLSLR